VNDETLRAFIRQSPDRDLDGVEADVWRRVAKRDQARRTGRVVATAQLGLACLVLAGGLTAGRAAVTSNAGDRSGLTLLSSADLAPSTLLVGR